MALLKLLLFGFLIYFVLKQAARLLFPFLFKNLENKINNNRNANYKKKEGEVTIQFDNNKKKSDNSKGEYIDFEEIKDE